MDYLIDVIGILSSVGREKVYERNRVATKFKVIELESNGIKLEYTLFGLYVNALDAFLQSGCNGNVVVVAQYLKVKLIVKIILFVLYSKRIFCPKCEKYVWTIVPSYRIKFRVIDETDFVTFVVFYRDCYLLTKKICVDLIDQMDCDDEPTILPTVIGELVEQIMLFKIVLNNDVNSGFEQSFCVKKLCPDQEIVAKFKNVVHVLYIVVHNVSVS
ncbi:unnamed protein product [Vicia faba]|uniref:Replication protein n=1 Tax=Vicia faba TaxID=3906 RepID=A0AAV0ZIM5_VICFA|nr:unnamed protein product [Vicia faba]